MSDPYGLDDFEPGIDFSKPRRREPLTPPPQEDSLEAEQKYLDPVQVAVEMLKHFLPEFESRIKPETMSVRIEGALPIAMQVSQQVISYPVRMPFERETPVARALREVTEDPVARAARLTKHRLYVETEVFRSVQMIVEELWGFAIKAVSLEPEIRRREDAAYERGKRAGLADGKAIGAREARAELLADAQEASRRIASAQIILAGGDLDADDRI